MLNIGVPNVSVCGSEERSTFNKNLVRILKTEYNRLQTAAPTGKHYVVKITTEWKVPQLQVSTVW
jgi:hypothetical protein